ncbi:MAG: formate transporter FocA [Anaerolineae bacterium]
MPNELRIDALLPQEMALRAEEVGMKKSALDFLTTFFLAILAGAFIALGAVFATTVTTGTADLPYGISKLLGGVVFCLGLILVIVGGAELFTGNNLIAMAWASGKVSTWGMLRNWGIVYVGNFVGSVGTAILMLLTRQYMNASGAVGLNALNIANAKCGLGFVQAMALGIMCNTLVCLAVWLTFSAHSTVDKIAAILFPITAFVAAGFEHSIANMYFIPIGLLIKAAAPAEFWALIGRTPADFANLTWANFLLKNLLPVTIGNVIGGSLLVGGIYWLIYMRRRYIRRRDISGQGTSF